MSFAAPLVSGVLAAAILRSGRSICSGSVSSALGSPGVQAGLLTTERLDTLRPTMLDFNSELDLELTNLGMQGLSRQLRRLDSAQGSRIRVEGQDLLNFSSNDYLGLANHPLLKEAAVRAIAEYGTGSGAARLVSGSLAPHHELEAALAEFKGTEAALTFSSGYSAAMGTIGALAGTGDIIILDRLAHACLIDASRLSGARLRVFKHNDPEDLQRVLRWASSHSSSSGVSGRRTPRVLIVTESVFSMDGDCAPLRELISLKEQFGAWLMVDEAHATGLFGRSRRGLGEAQGVSERIEIQMGTLGKALGAAGGYICGSRRLIDLLLQRARSFIFSTAPAPAVSAAASAGIRLVASAVGEERCGRVWEHANQWAEQTGVALPGLSRQPTSPIIPIVLGAEQRAVAASAHLRAQGLFVPAIRYPTVARGRARLRITLNADHTADDIAGLVRGLAMACQF